MRICLLHMGCSDALCVAWSSETCAGPSACRCCTWRAVFQGSGDMLRRLQRHRRPFSIHSTTWELIGDALRQTPAWGNTGVQQHQAWLFFRHLPDSYDLGSWEEKKICLLHHISHSMQKSDLRDRISCHQQAESYRIDAFSFANESGWDCTKIRYKNTHEFSKEESGKSSPHAFLQTAAVKCLVSVTSQPLADEIRVGGDWQGPAGSRVSPV